MAPLQAGLRVQEAWAKGTLLSSFIIVVEALSRIVLRAMDGGVLSGFIVGKECIRVFHLQFAADAIFFLGN